MLKPSLGFAPASLHGKNFNGHGKMISVALFLANHMGLSWKQGHQQSELFCLFQQSQEGNHAGVLSCKEVNWRSNKEAERTLGALTDPSAE